MRAVLKRSRRSGRISNQYVVLSTQYGGNSPEIYSRMSDIIPAIMPHNYADLCAKVERVASFVPFVQIDVMDGVFVASRSWPYVDGGPLKDAMFRRIASMDESFPHWQDLEYEFDLMIARPEDHVDEWVPLGAARLIVHHEAIADHDKFFSLDLLKDEARMIGSETVIEIGVAIGADTPLSVLDLYINKVDFVQLMGIKTIGYQGQSFVDATLERVNELRRVYPDLIISVDGGVSAETAPLLSAAGADRLVAGSAVFKADDPEEAIRRLSRGDDQYYHS